jgi:predicted permease
MGSASGQTKFLFLDVLRIPAMWAAVLALILNVFDVAKPDILSGLLSLLERGVVPLMLFSLGLSLEWERSRWRLIPGLVPVVLLRLLVVPFLVMIMTGFTGLSGDLRTAVVMEAAMPSMVLGIVICDRFNLDVSLYAAAVTVTTALSLVTLPMWFTWLSG